MEKVLFAGKEETALGKEFRRRALREKNEARDAEKQARSRIEAESPQKAPALQPAIPEHASEEDHIELTAVVQEHPSNTPSQPPRQKAKAKKYEKPLSPRTAAFKSKYERYVSNRKQAHDREIYERSQLT